MQGKKKKGIKHRDLVFKAKNCQLDPLLVFFFLFNKLEKNMLGAGMFATKR